MAAAEEPKRLEFPTGFKWGSSTSAAQIETASDHNWRGIEARDGSVLLRTTDHELRRTEDVQHIKRFGTIYRCSLDWARLQAQEGAEFDSRVIAEYRQFFLQLGKEGMEIMLVLYHFTHPRWLAEKGGWLEEETIRAYIHFTEQCIEHFGDLISYWNTFNEPNVYALNAYLLKVFPPYRRSYRKANRVLANMGQAHDIAHEIIKDRYPEAPIGISLNTASFEGLNWMGKLPAAFIDWWFHTVAARHFERVDFWGLSYYAYVPFAPMPVTEIERPGRLDELGIPHDRMWGYRPEGLGRHLRRFWQKYKKPIIVAESGICTDDPNRRINAIKDYLKVCHQAISEGIPVEAYIFWSTFDNFEWNLGNSYRFGLLRVDWDTMERHNTPAADFYEQITIDNAIDL